MKLSKEFSEFYSYIRIDEEADSLREKRQILEGDIKEKLPKELEKIGINIKKGDIRTFIQGSYKYNTTIKSEIVDMDVAVMIPVKTADYTDSRKLKNKLRDAITIPARTVSIKDPCVRASYIESGKEYMHIDLPLYADDNGSVYLARQKNDGKWESSDPEGLIDDLCEKINGNNQLRRIICFVKKWRDEKYGNASSDHEIPPSIGLTYLVCDNFVSYSSDDGEDDLLALQKTMNAVKQQFTLTYDYEGNITGADISRYLTVKPYSDIFTKMRESSSEYMFTFYKRLSVAVDNLTNAVNVESEHEAAKYVQKVLGDEFVVPDKKATNASTQTKKEHNFG